jgi:hypothetical protein
VLLRDHVPASVVRRFRGGATRIGPRMSPAIDARQRAAWRYSLIRWDNRDAPSAGRRNAPDPRRHQMSGFRRH